MLIAKHKIDLGKSLINPSRFLFEITAAETLATSKELFEESYGTHFIVGY